MYKKETKQSCILELWPKKMYFNFRALTDLNVTFLILSLHFRHREVITLTTTHFNCPKKTRPFKILDILKAPVKFIYQPKMFGQIC